MMKGLEALKEINECLSLEGALDSINEERISIIEKELKAFGIIVSKIQLGGFINSLKQTKNYEEYKNTYITLLTQEEYELLKEVLKDD